MFVRNAAHTVTMRTFVRRVVSYDALRSHSLLFAPRRSELSACPSTSDDDVPLTAAPPPQQAGLERWARLIPACLLMNSAGAVFASGPILVPEVRSPLAAARHLHRLSRTQPRRPSSGSRPREALRLPSALRNGTTDPPPVCIARR
jgi:hypothetical protein